MSNQFSRKGIKTVGYIFVLYAALVATHEGEFWPFSIYPMFSQAGNPWTRAIVLDVTDMPDDEIWQTQTLSGRTAEPVALQNYGIDQIDFSNFISKTERWTQERKKALQYMFGKENMGSSRWMASKVRGQLINDDSVSVEIVPFLLVTADSVMVNPTLDQSEYFKRE